MRRLLRNRTPAQLGWIIAVANLLIASSYAAFLVEAYHHPNSRRLLIWTAIFPFSLLIFGSIFEWRAESALRDGIASEQWTEALITPTRKTFTHPALAVASLLLIVVALAVVVFSGSRHSAALWIVLLPSLSLARVRAMFNPPYKKSGSSGLVDPPKTLQSEHWGDPPQRFSN
jgi:hypothetical protein